MATVEASEVSVVVSKREGVVVGGGGGAVEDIFRGVLSGAEGGLGRVARWMVCLLGYHSLGMNCVERNEEGMRLDIGINAFGAKTALAAGATPVQHRLGGVLIG
jgi:hypothetical protein